MFKRFAKISMRLMAAVCFVLAVLSTWLWVRSYETADRVHGRAWAKESFLVGAKQGRTVWYWFTSHGHAKWWQWDQQSHPADDEMSFPLGPIRQYESSAGFGEMGPAIYMVMPSSQTLEDGTEMMFWGAATATLNGGGVIVPFWVIVLGFFLLSILLSAEKPWQFGIRRLLFVVAVVATVLALASVLDREKPALELTPVILGHCGQSFPIGQ